MLQLNTHLDGAKHLFKDQVFGPENLLCGKEGLYTGIHGGEVVQLNVEKELLETITKVGEPCGKIYIGY